MWVLFFLLSFSLTNYSYGQSTGCEASGSPSSIWAEYESVYQARTKKVVLANPLIYNDPQDPYLKFLTQEMGARFTPPLFIPTLESIIQKLSAEIAGHVATGNYTADEVFLPARAYELPNGDIVGVAEGMPIPAGAVAHDGSLSGREYKKIILQGYQIIGAADASSNYEKYQTFTGHDLVHLWVFARHPSFAKALRNKLRKVEAEHGWRAMTQRAWSARFANILESAEIINSQEWLRIKETLEIPSRNENHIYTVSEVEAHLKNQIGERKIAQAQKKSYIAALARLQTLIFSEATTAYGGTAADPGPRHNNDNEFRSSMLQTAFRHASLRIQNLDSWIPYRRRNALFWLAHLYTAVANLSKITIEEMIEQGLEMKLDHASTYYKVFCASKNREYIPGEWDPFCE